MVEINDQEYQKLKDARELAESTIDTVREPLIVLDADLKVRSASRAFYQTFKVKPEETEGRFIYDLGNKQWNSPALRKLLEEIIPQNASFENYEVEHDFPGIGRRIMLLNARRIPRPPDKLRFVLLAFEDITERKFREAVESKTLNEAVLASEEKYRIIVESATDQIFLVDKELKYLAMNQAGLNRMKKTVDEVVGERMAEIFPKEIAARNIANLQKVFSTGQNYEIAEVLPLGGENLSMETSLSPVRDNIGQVVAVLGVVRDVSERKRVEKETNDAEARYKLLFDSSSDILVQLDSSGTIVDLNRNAEIVGGYKKEEIVGKNLSTLASKFTVPSLAAMVANFAKKKLGGQVGVYEVEAIGASGQSLIFEVNTVPLKDGAGREMGELGSLHDVTARKRAEKELSAKVKELEKLTKIMEGREDKIIELKQEVKTLKQKRAER